MQRHIKRVHRLHAPARNLELVALGHLDKVEYVPFPLRYAPKSRLDLP